MTSSNTNIFRVTDHLCVEFTTPGEFSTQRPVTRSFDVFFDLRPNKRLSKHWWGWWFEMPSHPLWRHCNASSAVMMIMKMFTSMMIPICLFCLLPLKHGYKILEFISLIVCEFYSIQFSFYYIILRQHWDRKLLGGDYNNNIKKYNATIRAFF